MDPDLFNRLYWIFFQGIIGVGCGLAYGFLGTATENEEKPKTKLERMFWRARRLFFKGTALYWGAACGFIMLGSEMLREGAFYSLLLTIASASISSLYVQSKRAKEGNMPVPATEKTAMKLIAAASETEPVAVPTADRQRNHA